MNEIEQEMYDIARATPELKGVSDADLKMLVKWSEESRRKIELDIQIHRLRELGWTTEDFAIAARRWRMEKKP